MTAKKQKESNTECTPRRQKSEEKAEVEQPSSQPVTAPSQWVLPLNAAGKPVNTLTPAIPTFTPQPVIVNSQVNNSHICLYFILHFYLKHIFFNKENQLQQLLF